MEDARLAHQASLEEQKEIEERRKREIELSEREIQRLRQLQLQKKGRMGARYVRAPAWYIVERLDCRPSLLGFSQSVLIERGVLISVILMSCPTARTGRCTTCIIL